MNSKNLQVWTSSYQRSAENKSWGKTAALFWIKFFLLYFCLRTSWIIMTLYATGDTEIQKTKQLWQEDAKNHVWRQILF